MAIPTRDGENDNPASTLPSRSSTKSRCAPVSVTMRSTPSREDIESARLKMLRARQALEDYERINGCAATSEHIKLSLAFRKAAQMYLSKLSRTEP